MADQSPHTGKRLGWAFWLSMAWIALTICTTLFADLLPLPDFDTMDWTHPAAPPGTPGQSPFVHLLGTDTMGRDILTRLIYGSRVSLLVGIIPPIIGLLAGGLLGTLAGFYRGRTDTLIMTAMDIVLAFPGLVLLLAITFYLGQGLLHIIAALGFLTIPSFSRVARANTLTLSQREFIQASRMIGKSDLYILCHDILPNLGAPLAVYALYLVSYMIVAEGSLSFLGLSVPAPMPSWGGMIAEGKEVLDQAAHISFFPALAMFLTVLSFNLTGDAVRGLVDSREGRS